MMLEKVLIIKHVLMSLNVFSFESMIKFDSCYLGVEVDLSATKDTQVNLKILKSEKAVDPTYVCVHANESKLGKKKKNITNGIR